jgi:hypothetical protein
MGSSHVAPASFRVSPFQDLRIALIIVISSCARVCVRARGCECVRVRVYVVCVCAHVWCARVCVCGVCARARVRACVRVCACVVCV